MTHPTLSIVIPTFGRNYELVETIKSLLPEAATAGADVLVVDQTPSHDELTSAALERWVKEGAIAWIKMEQPSLTAARNEGLRQSLSEVVLFVDDDVRVPKGFIRSHLTYYRHARTGGVTGQVFVPYDAERLNYDQPERSAQAHFSMKEPGCTDTFIGCNHSVRRLAMIEAGGYDTAYVASAHTEDFDAGHRLTAAGYSIQYAPDAWLFHTKAPAGGCRVGGSGAPEWTHTANMFIYAFRYAWKRRNFRIYLWQALRAGPLRKKVIGNPTLWLSGWVGLIQGCCYGWQHRRFCADKDVF